MAKVCLIILGGLALAGCGSLVTPTVTPAAPPIALATLPAPPPTGTVAATAAPTLTPVLATATPTRPATPPPSPSSTPAEADAAYPSEPPDVVRAFLGTLQDDLSGETSMQYLTSERQREVAQGRPLPVILGVQNIYDSFKVGEAESAEDASVHVKAVLEFRQPLEREFALVREDREWHITDIIPLNAGAYPPEQAVIDFLASLQADPSGEISLLYLSDAARAALGDLDLLAWLDLAQLYDSFEVERPASSEPPLELEAALRFGDEQQRRRFTLSREGDGWRIDAVR